MHVNSKIICFLVLACIFVHICVSMCPWVWIHICKCVRASVRAMSLRVWLCVHVCLCVCVYVFVYTYVLSARWYSLVWPPHTRNVWRASQLSQRFLAKLYFLLSPRFAGHMFHLTLCTGAAQSNPSAACTPRACAWLLMAGRSHLTSTVSCRPLPSLRTGSYLPWCSHVRLIQKRSQCPLVMHVWLPGVSCLLSFYLLVSLRLL